MSGPGVLRQELLRELLLDFVVFDPFRGFRMLFFVCDPSPRKRLAVIPILFERLGSELLQRYPSSVTQFQLPGRMLERGESLAEFEVYRLPVTCTLPLLGCGFRPEVFWLVSNLEQGSRDGFRPEHEAPLSGFEGLVGQIDHPCPPHPARWSNLLQALLGHGHGQVGALLHTQVLNGLGDRESWNDGLGRHTRNVLLHGKARRGRRGRELRGDGGPTASLHGERGKRGSEGGISVKSSCQTGTPVTPSKRDFSVPIYLEKPSINLKSLQVCFSRKNVWHAAFLDLEELKS